MGEDLAKLLRELPSVSELLGSPPIGALCREFGEGATKLELRRLIEEARADIRSGRRERPPDMETLVSPLRERLVRLCRPEGRAAINATGILLHTGLGRARLCREAVDALAGCGGHTVLQTDIETGKRCRRDTKIERLLVELTGCEAATVVNNNAAATMLILNTIAEGREVVLSRGQLVEIGGSFRMPDVMAKSGCTLREVGATNRTHLRDYEQALNQNTGAIMHVHTSNYRIRGFSGWPDIRELAALGRSNGIPVIDDLGSGALVSFSELGLPCSLGDEPLVKDSIAAGVDACCFSADKLICGPQSGVICGKREAVERIRSNPFARMFRTSRLELAALEATLLHFLNGTHTEALPFYRMLMLTVDELDARAEELTRAVGGIEGVSVSIEDDLSYVGSGSAPDEGIPTRVVRLAPIASSSEKLAKAIREGIPSVFARISEDAVVLDVRTIDAGEVDVLARSVKRAVAAVT